MSSATAEIQTSPDRSTPAIWLEDHPWVWSYAAAFLTWIAICISSGQGWFGTLTGTFGLVPFLVLVGIGQLFVISLGNGYIDLSVANTITLTAYVSTGFFTESATSLIPGIAAALGVACLIGLVNAVVILGLRVPPIVATLAVSLITHSIVLVWASKFPGTVNPALADFTKLRVGGISVLGVVCILVALVAAFVLKKTSYGRSVEAIGQKLRAAHLTDIRVTGVVVCTYLVSSLLAGTSGILLGAFSSPSLELGNDYLLNSVAVVVLGGSSIAGGRSFVTGVWGASLFMLLMDTLLDTMGLSTAVQDIVKGALIVFVLMLVGVRRRE